MWTHPFLETHWTGWRHRCWPGGNYAASLEVCKCHMVQHIPVHHGRPSCNSNRTSSAAFWQFFCSDCSSTSWNTNNFQVFSNEDIKLITRCYLTGENKWKYSKYNKYTHGTVNSKMLLRVCLSSITTAIWMKRSVKQPLGWHYNEHRFHNSFIKYW